MKKTFFVAEVCGASIPLNSNINDAKSIGAMEHSSTIVTGAMAGKWNKRSLLNMAKRRGIVLKRAYCVTHDYKIGYGGNQSVII